MSTKQVMQEFLEEVTDDKQEIAQALIQIPDEVGNGSIQEGQNKEPLP